MGNLEEHLIKELEVGCCYPGITKLAKKLSAPGATVHFNIRKMEKERKILAYKAVFDNAKINRGFSAFALVKLSGKAYEKRGFTLETARRIARHPQVESVDILTSEWELMVKICAKDQTDYLSIVEQCVGGDGIVKVNSLISLAKVKSEYVEI